MLASQIFLMNDMCYWCYLLSIIHILLLENYVILVIHARGLTCIVYFIYSN